MIIIVDKRIPEEALNKLRSFGKVIPFSSEGIVYEAISGHPDIFMSTVNGKLIVAPNLPDKFKNLLKENNIQFLEGEKPVGSKYPETAKYNIVSTNHFLIHNSIYSDSKIMEIASDLNHIHMNQGYVRCNILPLKNNHFITSDKGILQILETTKLNVLYINPDDIVLPGFKNGFIGGASGVIDDKVFIIGTLNKFKEGKKVKDYLEKLNYQIIELYDGPLFDGGCILFIEV